MTSAPHPYGPIESFDFTAHDSKIDDSAPIRTWVSFTMQPEKGPLLMIGLWLRETHNVAEAHELDEQARKIAELLGAHIKGVSLQTMP